MKKINKIIIFIYLINFLSNNMFTMQNDLRLLMLDNQAISNITKYIVDSYINEINNIEDIFDYDSINIDIRVKKDLFVLYKNQWVIQSNIKILIKNLEDLKNIKLQELINQIKFKYRNLTKDQLNSTLKNKLNNFCNSSDKKELKEALNLIFAGADINLKSDKGWTLLMWAVYKSDKNIVNLLLNYGAHINRDEDSWNVLMWAAYKGDKDILKLLLSYTAYINIENNFDLNILIRTANYGNKEILKLLLNHISNIRFKNKTISTILDLAKKNKYNKILKIINSHIYQEK